MGIYRVNLRGDSMPQQRYNEEVLEAAMEFQRDLANAARKLQRMPAHPGVMIPGVEITMADGAKWHVCPTCFSGVPAKVESRQTSDAVDPQATNQPEPSTRV
jgi:hypothetical protein